MKKNLFETVTETLLLEERYKAEDGTLLKATVYSDVMTMEPGLLKLLVDNEQIREKFFKDIDGVHVFDKQQFAWLIESKEFLPDSFTSYTNKIGLAENRKFISTSNDVVLDFPYKDCVLQGGQDKEDQKRQEIMFNETLASDEIRNMLAPKVFTNAKRYTAVGQKDLLGALIPDTIEVKEESGIEFKDDDNLIIKGNNLIALTSLLERFEGKIKLIYIDPPFNTGNDSFNYNDNFNHSSWLTFMKNRLEVALKLLCDGGIIFVHIDYNEGAYLEVIMNDIFHRENYLSTITVRSNSISGTKTQHKHTTILKNKDSILVYRKGKAKINPQFVEKDYWDTHYNSYFQVNDDGKYIKKSLKEKLVELGIIKNTDAITSEAIKNDLFMSFVTENKDKIFQTVGSIPRELKELSLKNKDQIVNLTDETGDTLYAFNGRRLSFLESTFHLINGKEKMAQLLGDLWTDIDFQNTQNQGVVSFTNAKKPEQLLRRIIDMATDAGDLVLDFFLGSGTTVAVAHKMGRQFIGIEQMDYVEKIAVERLKNVIEGEQGGISKSINWQGGGSFVYCELKENAQTLIDAIQKATEGNISIIKTEIYNDKRIVPYLTREELLEVDKDFESLSLKDKKKALIKLVDKNKLYINYSDIDDEDFNISEEDKKFSRSFYEVD